MTIAKQKNMVIFSTSFTKPPGSPPNPKPFPRFFLGLFVGPDAFIMSGLRSKSERFRSEKVYFLNNILED